MSLIDRFLKSVALDTTSDENCPDCPSSKGQWALVELLRDEMTAMGMEKVKMDEHCYVYGSIPGNDPGAPNIGLIAHMDTVDAVPGGPIHPRVFRYEGGDIVLNREKDIVMREKDFASLADHVGKDLIVTDGTTLLGADDKAGIAEIITAMMYLRQHPEIKHGKVRIAFNPDEEIGLGAHKFNVPLFGCDFAYTMDGGEVGELEFENFNAASAKITFKGSNVHPGTAKDKMINASLLAMEFLEQLPEDERPEHTEGYEGFYHLTSMAGTVEEAYL